MLCVLWTIWLMCVVQGSFIGCRACIHIPGTRRPGAESGNESNRWKLLQWRHGWHYLLLEHTQLQHWSVWLVWWVDIACFYQGFCWSADCRLTSCLLWEIMYLQCMLLGCFMYWLPVTVDPSVLQTTLIGHSDAIWGLSMHNSRMHLLSCSSDATVRLWNPNVKLPLLSTFRIDTGTLMKCSQCVVIFGISYSRFLVLKWVYDDVLILISTLNQYKTFQ